jgi:acyl-coenzyme A synthetase/AMP-(fatty) acid ligase/acyl carrier protein
VPALILSDDTVRDPIRLIGELRRHKVTRLLAVPSLLRSLLDSGREIGLELPHLKLWFASGEPLPRDLADRFAAFVPDGTLVNLYGSSEVAGDVTVGWVTPGSSSVDIGHPIANTQIHILDDELEPVPRGVPGRIYAAGANLARGYLRRPGLTAASFVPNPFGVHAGARMYDTGDRGRWLRDDTIEFLGRRDDQVKVRGFRVELGHVEHALLEHPRVTQVAVMLVDRSGVDRQLVAYVETDANTADLRSHARLRLPEHMVPGTFVRVDDLPLKPNGKIDRSAVAAIAAPVVSEHEYIAPATDAELRMSEMWSELLVADRVGSDDHFFELGGHSLLATRLVSLVRERLDIEMPLTLVFERPILGEMAAALEDLVMAEIDALSDDEMQCEPQT